MSIAVRYFLHWQRAYIVAMVPALRCWRMCLASLMLTAPRYFLNSYGGMVTHYAGAAGPVIWCWL